MTPALRFHATTRALTLALLAAAAAAHSHLADPLPTRQLHCRVGGNARPCHGPCPVNDDYGRLNPVTASQPAEVWGRGAWVNVRWHRDNRTLERPVAKTLRHRAPRRKTSKC